MRLREVRAFRGLSRGVWLLGWVSLLTDAATEMIYPLLPVYYYVSRRLVQPHIAAPAINPMNRTYSKYFRVAR